LRLLSNPDVAQLPLQPPLPVPRSGPPHHGDSVTLRLLSNNDVTQLPLQPPLPVPRSGPPHHRNSVTLRLLSNPDVTQLPLQPPLPVPEAATASPGLRDIAVAEQRDLEGLPRLASTRTRGGSGRG
jgi:hypothetical protein